jgi:alpha-ketoglutarate-dependent taurine dioxygenase
MTATNRANTYTTQWHIKPLHPTFGALIEGIQLHAAFDGESVAALRNLLIRHKVLIFEIRTLPPTNC